MKLSEYLKVNCSLISITDFKVSGIYIIYFECSDKYYVGSAVNLYNRRNVHLSNLRNNKHGNKWMQKIYDKYTDNSFKFYIVEYCNRNSLEEREQYYLDKYFNNPNFINLSPSANTMLNFKHSNYSKEKISKYFKGRCNYKLQKKIYQYDLNGNLLNTWCGMSCLRDLYKCRSSKVSSSIMNRTIFYNTLLSYKDIFDFNNKEIYNKINNIKSTSRRIAILNDKKEIVQKFDSMDIAAKFFKTKLKPNIYRAINNNVRAFGYYWKFLN